MTDQERHEARYQRRRAKREQAKKQRASEITIEKTITFLDLYRLGKTCCNGVRWKRSTQNFERHLLAKTAKSRRAILDGTWKPDRFYHFTLCERGKVREIDAPRIHDRQVHKILTRKVLLPLYMPQMIYNNGASMKGKGLSFSMEMLKQDLRKHFRKYGQEGHILLLDFEKFFPTASHDVVLRRHEMYIRDEAMRALLNKAGALTEGGTGLPLGVELNQAEMIALPSEMDNFTRCQLSLKRFGHYMDDYYVLLGPGAGIERILDEIEIKATENGLHLNRKKTKAIPLTKPFRFCKAKFTITETGRIIVNGARDGMYRAKQKMNKFKGKDMKWEHLRTCVQSYLAYYHRYDSHSKELTIIRTFYAIYGFDPRLTTQFRLRDGELCDTSYTSGSDAQKLSADM